MNRFLVEETPLRGLVVLERTPIGDSRGYLERAYCRDALGHLIGDRHIVQVNRTLTRQRGTIRGMHFQRAPYAEAKIIQCLAGSVFDVAVDLRLGSPTFLQWFGVELAAENRRTVVIPEGFAHGFQTLMDDCELLYLHTAPFTASAEGGIDALDRRIGIDWPVPITERSARDRAWAPLSADFTGYPS